ncbi:MAG: formate dehydrogenase subunit delta [Rhodobacteraceae bacterium]|nr:formate dehydrogenase subunit delta [Paracoccaceae bacterium]MBR9819575.1 formate dehydrogenase subunit delta [Paracoccaceae bacterium]
MSPEKLTMMANQIAAFFKTQPGTDGAERLAAHLNDFWDPRMRAQFFAHLEAGGQGLDPLVVDAAQFVRRPAEA